MTATDLLIRGAVVSQGLHMSANPSTPSGQGASYGALSAALDQARREFGLNLMRWRRLNGWTQETPEQWGKAAGFAPIQNSQWSKMERGQQPKPGPLLFRCLGVINVKLYLQDFAGLRPGLLQERIRQGKAICHEDGNPWHGRDFYASFIGELTWPPFPGLERTVTEKEAEAWNQQLQQWFEQIKAAADLSPLAALQNLMQHVPEGQQEAMQEAVLGMGGFSASVLESLSDDEGLGPETWLRRWQQALGLDLPMALGPWWRNLRGRLQETKLGTMQ